MKKTMHLGWFSGHGLGPGANMWNDDRMPAGYEWDRPEMYIEMTQMIERAGFDFLIFADTSGIPDDYQGSMDAYIENAVAMPKLDPAVLAPMLAVHTSSIGIVPTLSTTYYPPYLLARLTATLDHVSEGRIGWNIVTSASERGAENFGLDGLTPHDERYVIADEYLEVCKQLWSSWEPDAVVMDAATGIFADPSKVHAINHAGTYFSLLGPLNVTPSPQGRPFLVQAGSSPSGVQFAGKHADAVIVPKNDPEQMRDFRDRIRARAAECGRDPDDVKVFFIVALRVAQSDDAFDARDAHVSPERRLEIGLAQMGTHLGIDFSTYPLDEPLVKPDGFDGPSATLFTQFLRPDGTSPTLREVAEETGKGLSYRISGTPEQIADRLEDTFDEVGGDGFVVRGSWIPDDVNDIANQVVGVLRRRGRIAAPDPSLTLRERVRR